jgi:raffinose/stachyose/melibiose transport system substrate-binding protein
MEGGATVKRRFAALAAALAILLAACTSANPSTPPAGASQPAASGGGGQVSLTIESWRNDDLTIWSDKIIPAFQAKYPNIKVTFNPTAPADYNGVLNTKLEGGQAGDLITCRPFDASLELFKKGYLASINDLPNLKNFGDVAKSAWITDDGKDVFCMPMASVIHGFIYNKEAFDKLGVTAMPTTLPEFHALLDKIKKDGKYTPLAMGTKDLWESATMGFQNIGPNFWKGEEGRKALIAGTAKFTDKPYVDTWKELASWKPYLPSGVEAIAYPDAQQLFSSGKAAMYPAGSWDIAYFESQGVKIGFFGPPLPKAGDTCYVSDHTDIAVGMNAKTAHPQEAKTFLDWVGSDEFATLYANALPGFYSLSNNPVTLSDPVAQQAVDLRKTCKSTIRNSYQILSRGDTTKGQKNLENELWRVTAAVINGNLTPANAAKEIQDGLDQWYKPAS